MILQILVSDIYRAKGHSTYGKNSGRSNAMYDMEGKYPKYCKWNILLKLGFNLQDNLNCIHRFHKCLVESGIEPVKREKR